MTTAGEKEAEAEDTDDEVGACVCGTSFVREKLRKHKCNCPVYREKHFHTIFLSDSEDDAVATEDSAAERPHDEDFVATAASRTTRTNLIETRSRARPVLVDDMSRASDPPGGFGRDGFSPFSWKPNPEERNTNMEMAMVNTRKTLPEYLGNVEWLIENYVAYPDRYEDFSNEPDRERNPPSFMPELNAGTSAARVTDPTQRA
jgi:hypothetical protein